MIAKETASRKKSTPIPPGMYQGTCYSIVDRGTRHDERFDKDKREITITFEIPSVRIDIEKDGETKSLPRAISQTFTLSLHEKSKLRGSLESWRNKPFTAEELRGFDVKNLLGKSCLLNLVPSATGEYTNIGAMNPLMAGMEPPAQENPNVYFSFDDCVDGQEPAWPTGMPAWLIDIAKESDEYRNIISFGQSAPEPVAPTQTDDTLSEEVPF